jgi:hypothetical protein
MSLFDILAQAANANSQQAGQHFDNAVQHATRDDLARGVSGVFRAPETPPFDQMVGQLFGNSNNVQQAGVLNQLLRAAGPAIAAAVAGGALKNVLAGGKAQVTPAEAAKVTPEEVQVLAKSAETQYPGIVDKLGKFYAENPTLVKTIGGAAMLVLLSKMKEGMRNSG